MATGPLSADTRAKISAALCGHVVSEETRQKIAEGNRGRVYSPETRAKLRRGDHTPPNPSGLCVCGCGGVTAIAKRTRRDRRQLIGQHMRYLPGHSDRSYRLPPPPVAEDRGHSTPCHIWQGALTVGYGSTSGGLAHRVAYERQVGPIPAGFEIDHLCRQRACVNVEHLEPVKPADNVRRQRHVRLTLDSAVALRRRALSESGTRNAIAKRLAPEYGLARGLISAVLYGYTWKDAARLVPDPRPIEPRSFRRSVRRPHRQTWVSVLAGDPCAYCGAPSEQVDHIDPKSRGGGRSWTNTTAVCRPCNRAKTDRPLLEFLLSRVAA